MCSARLARWSAVSLACVASLETQIAAAFSAATCVTMTLSPNKRRSILYRSSTQQLYAHLRRFSFNKLSRPGPSGTKRLARSWRVRAGGKTCVKHAPQRPVQPRCAHPWPARSSTWILRAAWVRALPLARSACSAPPAAADTRCHDVVSQPVRCASQTSGLRSAASFMTGWAPSNVDVAAASPVGSTNCAHDLTGTELAYYAYCRFHQIECLELSRRLFSVALTLLLFIYLSSSGQPK